MMNTFIKTYEDYCKAFKTEEEKNTAYLLLSLQTWLINIDDIFLKDDSISSSLDQLLNRSTISIIPTEDYLTWIVKHVINSIEYLSKHMKEDILRENIKMPFYKAKEFNSQCFNWLSRQPGDNIKEKIVNSSKNILAVKRRMSYNTGENRLYISLVKEILNYELIKIQYINERNINLEEKRAIELFQTILQNNDYNEIEPWGNGLPNNTLLADRNYRQIWSAWNTLRVMDKNISKLSDNIIEKQCLCYFVDCVSMLSNFLKFPQCPVKYDVEEFSLDIFTYTDFFGIDNAGNKCIFHRLNNQIVIEYLTNTIDIKLDLSKITFVTKERVISFENNVGSKNKILSLIVKKLGFESNIQVPIKLITVKEDSICIDLYSVRPTYINDDNKITNIPGLALLQEFNINGRNELLPCDTSKALYSDIPIFSFINCIENSYAEKLSFLTHLLEKYYKTNNTTILIPDKFDVFQLSSVIKAVKTISSDIFTIPRSIGTVFYQTMCDASISEKDVFIVADFVDNYLSLTIIKGQTNLEIKNQINDYNGIVWERHPTKTFDCRQKVRDFCTSINNNSNIDLYNLINIFGFSGTREELRHIPLINANGSIFSFNLNSDLYKKLSNFYFSIDSYINSYIDDNVGILKGKKIHIVSLNHTLTYNGDYEFGYNSIISSLKGCKYYQTLQNTSKIQLWKDYLPSLSIKLLYGSFDLIRDEAIYPIINVDQKIQIKESFILSKGKKEYQFSLVKGDSNQTSRYAAIVKNQVFPLPVDVECELKLTYRYGSDKPFTLFFSPKQQDQKYLFREAKVLWEKITEYPYEDLIYPAFPKQKNWTNLLSENASDITYINDVFKALNYHCFDLKNIQYSLLGHKEGQRTIKFKTEIDGEQSEIILNERYIENDDAQYRHFSFDNIGSISMNLSLLEEKDSANILSVSLPDNINWFGPPNNKTCIIYLDIGNNETIKVFISQSQFEFPEDFSFDVKELSFSLSEPRINSHRLYLNDSFEWRKNDHGYYCFKSILIDGTYQNVAFYSSYFQDPFDFNIQNISFEIEEKAGKYKATKIRNEDIKSYTATRINLTNSRLKRFFAHNIRIGDKPPSYFYTKTYTVFQRIFSNNLPFDSSECPSELRVQLMNNVGKLINIIDRMKNPFIKARLISMLCMISDIDSQLCIDYLCHIIQQKNEKDLVPHIGYSLGNLKTDSQKRLLSKIESLPESVVICILAKAIWLDSKLILNLDKNFVLKWLDLAIDNLENYMHDEKKINLSYALEFILGVFRLRSCKDEYVLKYLSLNNDKIKLLYLHIEKIIHEKIKFKSFLKLQIENKGAYQDIPDLLYALLIYITGQKGEEGIMISGISDIEEEGEA